MKIVIMLVITMITMIVMMIKSKQTQKKIKERKKMRYRQTGKQPDTQTTKYTCAIVDTD